MFSETTTSKDLPSFMNLLKWAIIPHILDIKYNVSEYLLLDFRRSNICHSLNSIENPRDNCNNIQSKKSSVWKWCFTSTLTKVNKSIKTDIKVKKNPVILISTVIIINKYKMTEQLHLYLLYFPQKKIICEHKQNYFRLISEYVFSISLFFPVSLSILINYGVEY